MLSGYNLEKEASEYSDNEFFKFISKKDEVLTNEDIKGNEVQERRQAYASKSHFGRCQL